MRDRRTTSCRSCRPIAPARGATPSCPVSRVVRSARGATPSRRVRRSISRAVGPLLLLALAGLSLLAVSCGVVSGSGNVVTRELDLSGFTRVEVRDSFKVSVTRAESHGVTLRIDDNLEDYLDVSVDGDTLHIGLEYGNSYRDVTASATVRLPDLRALELGGDSDGSVSGFTDGGPLLVSVGGDSTLRIADLASSRGELEVDGSSDVEGSWSMTDGDFRLSGDSDLVLSGSAGSLSLSLSGDSTAELPDFAVETLTADFSGDSDATVTVNGTIEASLSGDSTLRYFGSPVLREVDTSGDSEVRPAM